MSLGGHRGLGSLAATHRCVAGVVDVARGLRVLGELGRALGALLGLGGEFGLAGQPLLELGRDLLANRETLAGALEKLERVLGDVDDLDQDHDRARDVAAGGRGTGEQDADRAAGGGHDEEDVERDVADDLTDEFTAAVPSGVGPSVGDVGAERLDELARVELLEEALELVHRIEGAWCR